MPFKFEKKPDCEINFADIGHQPELQLQHAVKAKQSEPITRQKAYRFRQRVKEFSTPSSKAQAWQKLITTVH